MFSLPAAVQASQEDHNTLQDVARNHESSSESKLETHIHVSLSV